MILDNPVLFAVIFGFLAVFLGLYGFLAPKKEIRTRSTGQEFFSQDEAVADNWFGQYVRPMLRNFLPQSPLSNDLSNADHDKISELLIRSGNPWNIRPEEYRGVQFLFAVVGLGIGILLVATSALPIPWFLTLLLPGFIGYVYPISVHRSAKEKRSKEVQRQLPEALDLLVVAMTAGQNFEPAMEQISPKLPDGLLKEEFARITKELHAGRTLDTSMKSFARRNGSDDAEGFVKAILQAQALGSDVSETLKQQANAARTNYEARLEKKIASLSSRMFLFIVPTMLPAIMIIFLAPALGQLTQSGFL